MNTWRGQQWEKKPELKDYTPVVDGAGQIGQVINTRGWPPNYQIGYVTDYVTFQGCQVVNPQTHEVADWTNPETGEIYPAPDFQVCLTTAVKADENGWAALPITPALIPKGQYKNCSASPANGALIWTLTEVPPTEFLQELHRRMGH